MYRYIKAESAFDDIKRQIADNDAWLNQNKDDWDKRKGDYEQAYEDQREFVENEVKQILHKYIDPLDLKIRFEDWLSNSLRVSIEVNDFASVRHSLRWSYTVILNSNGEIEKESNSWSGVDVTSQQALDDLQLSIDCLQVINNIDWEEIFNSWNPPNEDDYFYGDNPYNIHDEKDRELQSQLKDAVQQEFQNRIAPLVGTTKIIKDKANWWWYQITKETPKRYYCDYISDKTVQNWIKNCNAPTHLDDLMWVNTKTFSKDEFKDMICGSDYDFDNFDIIDLQDYSTEE